MVIFHSYVSHYQRVYVANFSPWAIGVSLLACHSNGTSQGPIWSHDDLVRAVRGSIRFSGSVGDVTL